MAEIIYKENIKKGTEYVGVLLLGSNFNPVWIGNRIKKTFLYKDKKTSFWQTPTITPVAMSALAACCWMIENKDKGGIYFPDDILEYKEIIDFAERYISAFSEAMTTSAEQAIRAALPVHTPAITEICGTTPERLFVHMSISLYAASASAPSSTNAPLES